MAFPKSANRNSAVVFLFLFFLPAALFGQNKTKKASILEGPEVEEKRSSVTGIIGHDNTGYYVLRMQKTRYWIDHIDSRMQVDKTAEIPEPSLEKIELYFDFCGMVDEKLYVFYYAQNSKESKYTLYGQEVNKSALEVTGELQELMTVSYVKRRGLMKTRTSPFTGHYSPDESELLVASRDFELDSDKDEPKEIIYQVAVFKADLQKTMDREIRLKYSPALFSIDQLKLDDKGNILMVGIEFQERSVARQSRRDGKPQYKYHLLRFTKEYENDIVIDLKGKFITDLQVGEAPNGDVIVCGFFSETGTFSIRGAFYMALDPKTNEVKVQNSSEFDTKFITQYFTEKETKKEKKKEAKGEEPELANFRMDELLIKTDGGATMIAEQYFVYSKTYTTTDAKGNTTTRTVYYYNYNDIIVLNFLPDGSLSWKCKIPKRQTTTNDDGYYSSYAYAAVGDKLYIVFNDNPKNLFVKPGEKVHPFIGSIFGSKELAVVLVEVDNTGKTSRELLMTSVKGDVLIRPKICEQTGPKEMIICGQRTKMYQFSKVTFK